jgi:hypothetical protein
LLVSHFLVNLSAALFRVKKPAIHIYQGFWRFITDLSSFKNMGVKMASVEIIGLLCAGSMRYHERRSGRIPGGRRSGDQLTRDELAGLLSGLDAASMNLAFAKYANDLDAERQLIAQVRVWTAGVAVKELWQIVKGRPTVVNMAALAVFEVVRPNRCCHCHGVGIKANKVCPTCNGTGFKAISGSKISAAMCIDKSNFCRTWHSRYELVYRHVADLDQRVNSVLARSNKLDVDNRNVFV